MSMYRNLVSGMAILMILIGAALILRTLPQFGVGIVLGVLFMAAGIGRLLLLRRRS
jgi:hypothetical protein